ncbi:UPF0496 protein At3g19330 [Dendrobium catenatum]|uniref:UPF0496 protein n=1 Tax=Dendrobium catenatum TaxID=906689 RepID=A0A2I0WFI8_9ASPA|nr:UPF0496 protein At3g19330 [Dendrobium catenatum]PKU74425.1 UPF0496 protein [Dendrobium catenatum]
MSSSAAASSGTRGEDEDDGENWKKRTVSPASSASAENSPSVANINLRREYTLAVQTSSYNEMWSIIHHRNGQGDVEGDGEEILRPDRASVEEAIRLARPTRLTRLVSRYLESSEQASDLFLSLRRSVDLAREMYSPIALLLDVLPATSPIPSPAAQSVPSLLSLPQCDSAFDVFVDFDRRGNPFQAAADGFVDIRDCFSVLKQQLELRLLTARRRHRLLRRATIASATCLVVSVTGAVVAALVLASHALLAVAAMGPVALCCGGSDVLAGRRRHLRERMSGTDAAARETYVLDKHLSTVERLVARLHATVESDMVLVRLGLERGRGQIHPIQEVVRQLRKNHCSFRHQLTDLDEHVCLCLAALNRARSLLLQQIHRLRSTG